MLHQTTNWVATEIVKEVRLKQRVDLIEKWIRVLQVLLKLKNYNGVMEILVALNINPVKNSVYWTVRILVYFLENLDRT